MARLGFRYVKAQQSDRVVQIPDFRRFHVSLQWKDNLVHSRSLLLQSCSLPDFAKRDLLFAEGLPFREERFAKPGRRFQDG